MKDKNLYVGLNMDQTQFLGVYNKKNNTLDHCYAVMVYDDGSVVVTSSFDPLFLAKSNDKLLPVNISIKNFDCIIDTQELHYGKELEKQYISAISGVDVDEIRKNMDNDNKELEKSDSGLILKK